VKIETSDKPRCALLIFIDSMKITAAEKGIDEVAAIERGLQEKAREFQEAETEVYPRP
jgi:hypothetical protein